MDDKHKVRFAVFREKSGKIRAYPPQWHPEGYIQNSREYFPAIRIVMLSEQEWIDSEKFWRFIQDPVQFLFKDRNMTRLGTYCIRYGTRERELAELWDSLYFPNHPCSDVPRAEFFCRLSSMLGKTDLEPSNESD